MWWEILPPFGIMTGLFAVAYNGVGPVRRLVNGKSYVRNVEDEPNFLMFQRDRAHSRPTFFTRYFGFGVSDGNPYQTHGLEAIPDKQPSS